MTRLHPRGSLRHTRWSLLLAALLVLPGQAAVLLHMGTASHGVCADHGEAVELASGGHDEASAAHAPAAPGGGHDGPAEDSHADHHCVALQFWNHSLRPVDAPVLMSIPPRTAGEANAPAFDLRGPRLPTWRLAPKHSPPTG